jgi:ribosomal protein L11 methyltransferase
MPIATHHILTLEILRNDAESLAERIEADWGYSVIQLERPNHDRAWLEMYFEQAMEAEIAATVMGAWPEVFGHQIRQESPRDWQTFWRHHFHTSSIGQHLRIVPIWEKDHAGEAVGGRQTIWLDPGLSFGTGDHFTTRFCLEMIDRLVPAAAARNQPVRSMLDVGTGSAILAIGARLLGVEKVCGFDYDAIALEQAFENVALNGLTGQIALSVSDITRDPPPEGSFDLVCANVYTTILLQIAPSVCACSGRYLVLSGIRDPELDQVSIAYTALGFEEIFRDGNGEWGGLAFQRVPKGLS